MKIYFLTQCWSLRLDWLCKCYSMASKITSCFTTWFLRMVLLKIRFTIVRTISEFQSSVCIGSIDLNMITNVWENRFTCATFEEKWKTATLNISFIEFCSIFFHSILFHLIFFNWICFIYFPLNTSYSSEFHYFKILCIRKF